MRDVAGGLARAELLTPPYLSREAQQLEFLVFTITGTPEEPGA